MDMVLWLIGLRKKSAAVMFLTLLLCLSSCSPKVFPTYSDSVRVEIRERVIHDSVCFEIEKEVEKVITRDTVSHLENSYAESDAIVKDGFLHHSLSSIPQKIYVPYTVTQHDTTFVEKSAETIIKEIPAQLTHWQTFCLVLGKIALGLIVILSLCAVAYIIVKSKLKR